MSKMFSLTYSTAHSHLENFTMLNSWRNRTDFCQLQKPSGHIEEAINSHTTGKQ